MLIDNKVNRYPDFGLIWEFFSKMPIPRLLEQQQKQPIIDLENSIIKVKEVNPFARTRILVIKISSSSIISVA